MDLPNSETRWVWFDELPAALLSKFAHAYLKSINTDFVQLNFQRMPHGSVDLAHHLLLGNGSRVCPSLRQCRCPWNPPIIGPISDAILDRTAVKSVISRRRDVNACYARELSRPRIL